MVTFSPGRPNKVLVRELCAGRARFTTAWETFAPNTAFERGCTTIPRVSL